MKNLSISLRKKLTLENDDRSFSPKDLLPFCKKVKIPFLYDIHHHRCLKDGLKEDYVTKEALKTWDREPVFHVSSPKGGWKAKNIKKHADYINVKDFPIYWKKIKDLTVEIEAKKKELAVLDIMKKLKSV